MSGTGSRIYAYNDKILLGSKVYDIFTDSVSEIKNWKYQGLVFYMELDGGFYVMDTSREMNITKLD